MASRFVHLHTHSHYSLLNALPQIPALVKAAKAKGMDALALTDNGNLYGAVEFFQACKKNDIKPILGVDLYVAARTRFDKQHGVDSKRTRLILLAKDMEGYKNLVRIVTDSHLEGYYYKPRVDAELLAKYTGGLICILPSFTSETSFMMKMEDFERGALIIERYRKMYGKENVYLEITHHPEIPNHDELMKKIIKLGHQTGTPLVAAHDVYYINPDDRLARDTLMSISAGGGGKGDSEVRALEESEEDFSMISPETAEEYFKDIPEALDNCRKIADECNLDLKLGKWYFPDVKIEAGKTHDEVLRDLVFAGIEKRKLEKTEEAMTRIEYELKVIKDKGYANYFLTVSDLLHFAHDNKILTTIRGSVAGSLVTYLAQITNVNPLEYKLPFERFLNPERPSAPDIDMDYADNRRDDVINYARQKYGVDKVAQIGTFGTMMAKGAVRDTARALGFPYAVGDRLSKLIPMGAQGFPMTIERALEEVPDLKKIYDAESDAKQIIDMARKIEGCARHISVHAAGVVISPDALTEHTPLQYDTKGDNKLITQYDMHAVGEDGVGLLKFDFLGIRNLAILADAVDRVEKRHGNHIDIENVPVDDKKTFEMLARGETIGLFQLNGSGMTRYLKELRPSTIHDINAMVALYRPGPMESIPEYIRRKHNPMLVQYLDPRMKDITDRSYGIITYQDDVMMISIKLAGYSWLEADKLRKAMGKKIPAEMEAQRTKLLEGFVKHGMSKEKAEELWKLIEPFAAYGFNKCLTGDALLTDAKTGERMTIKEIYESNRQMEIHALGDNLKLATAKISAVMENGIKKIFELKTRSGRIIKATGNHPFYGVGGWQNLEVLKPGDRIAVPRKIESAGANETPAYRMAALGYLVSEGNLCHPHGIYYYSSREDEVADYISSASRFENAKIKINKSRSAQSAYVGQADQKKGNSLAKWIAELGLRNKKATEKFVPRFVFGESKESIAVFLGKLWQGDGAVSVKNTQLFYATSSHRLAHDVQHLLLRFGIISTIHSKHFKYRGTIKDGWTVAITHRDNISAFANGIGIHLIGPKRAALLELNALSLEVIAEKLILARGTRDTIPSPFFGAIRESMLASGLSAKVLAERTGLAERLFGADSRKKGYQRAVVAIMADALQSAKLRSHAESDIFWDEVALITPCGEEMTYDLTVPPHHNFVANDIIVHNSHAASYGKVAYQTSYMKANYPALYMSAVLTAESGDTETVAEVIAECKRMGIPVLPPDINESFQGFTVVADAKGVDQIRFGLTTIKNFGEGISNSIIEERERGGKFKSIADFLDRIKDRSMNRKSLESLIKCGAFDNLGERGQLLANIEGLLAYNKEHGKVENQDSLFGSFGDAGAVTVPGLRLEPAAPAPTKEKLQWEKELLGLYVSGHPLEVFREKLAGKVPISKIKETMGEGAIAVVSGIIEEIRPMITKKGDNMAFIKISDMSTSLDCVAFPKAYKEFAKLLVPEACIAIKGKISHRNGEVSMLIDAVKGL